MVGIIVVVTCNVIATKKTQLHCGKATPLNLLDVRMLCPQLLILRTSWSESQLSADHVSISNTKEVVTNRTPGSIVAYLQQTHQISVASRQPYITTSALYRCRYTKIITAKDL